MKPSVKFFYQAIAALVLTCGSWLHADVIETKDGARLVGVVKAVDGANVVIDTAYAGTIKVKQSQVVSIQTDSPLFYRLSGGTVVQGTVASTADGQIVIRGTDAAVTTTVSKVAATWTPSGKDPAIAALERKWSYTANVDITGKTGNKDQLGTSVGFRAKLDGANDTLQFYSNYNSQETDGVKSSDQFRAGVDYQNNFAGHYSWYVRSEGGYDNIKDIDLYTVSAFGMGYDVIKNPVQTLQGRVGLSFRYEGYGTVGVEDVSSAGLDFGINHSYKFTNAQMVNSVTFVPTFEDFGVFRAIHDSYFEMPISASLWKLRIGVNNDYNSDAVFGVEKLDTTYYTRLVLIWK